MSALEAIEAARRRATLEIREQQRVFANEIESIFASAVDRGMLHSSVTQRQMGDAIRKEYLLRARLAWGSFERLLRESSSVPSGASSDWLGRVTDVLDASHDDLHSAHDRSAGLMKRDHATGSLSDFRSDALEVIAAEIELFLHARLEADPRLPAELASLKRPSMAERIKKHPLVALVALVSAALIGLVALQSSLTTLVGWLSPYVPPVSRYADQVAVAKLVPGSHLSTFESALGPFKFRTAYGQYVEYIFVRPNCYVQALTDSDGRILMFAVTVRNKEFHPEFRLPDVGSPPQSVRLGESTFASTGIEPESIRGVFGASYMHYMEFTRLSHAEDFLGVILATNDSGEWWEDVDSGPAPFNQEDYPEPLQDAIETNDPSSPAIQWYRRSTIVNTYGEAAPDFDPTSLFEKDGLPKSALVVGPDRVSVQSGADVP